MAFKYGKFNGLKTKTADCKCGHPGIVHYTRDGNCVYPHCGCLSYRSSSPGRFKNVQKGKCHLKHAHNSPLEIRVCGELYYQKMAKDIVDFDAERTLDLKGPSGKTIATYKIDFIVWHKDETVEYIEVKGRHLEREGQWPLKWKLLQDMYDGDPKVKFRVIFG